MEPQIRRENLASVFHPGDVVICKHNKSQPLSRLLEGDEQHYLTHGLWDRARRFAAYYYFKHVSALDYAPWCRDPQNLLRGASRMVLFDDDSWLVTRLTPQPALLDHPWLAGAVINKIYSAYMDKQRQDIALSAYFHAATPDRKPPRSRVRPPPADHHVVSVFENKEQTIFVIMEMDNEGEVMFYHDCLRCKTLACDQCMEVLENVAVFGRKYTRVE
ncbi:hypothetical protein J7T55_011125 [Diaporthe amygdali]|uniref:uncharacterized protein n=1 Tax=Phomopsis amygdali TaxID=1214568 RepID=UPI0022FEEBE9|nr:uncharacterized protein J7T55_011125 [Diaporthe amygdali]KAJ0104341.1 hypothetical protein J7T55_011125 [Diaporthe amygdali]